ncbi:hypothetical protein XO10_06790 [Marinitoga sp. 1135]|uniref:Uncharacterized protein n=1 Tax=Marinitoga piezophila (strain DSM 14283 / JCM 11233 / KA3) TaxID=443254 RepID=H2J3G0_MARPK|nr:MULTISPECIES: hypothetical protein [Marinitoga]AEX85776.1 hypothetical protein Marpi_1376 [Marinitoga piezophila KA3]APT76218.1 hypothetical protein LN42_07350 [Marinitoga sp. 1137]NUU95977.1 hypothetical protein [Marinitoga sp. 1135]NUU97889.1 hypothetical protein [Marinitoga sp. 1138]
MVKKYYYNNKYLFKEKIKEKSFFGEKRINIVHNYGIIKKFSDKDELNMYIINNARDYESSKEKVGVIDLGENMYYLYLKKSMFKYRFSIKYDYYIPINLLLWKHLSNNDFSKYKTIVFEIQERKILYYREKEFFEYGIYINNVSEDIYCVNLDCEKIKKIILEGDFKNVVGV